MSRIIPSHKITALLLVGVILIPMSAVKAQSIVIITVAVIGVGAGESAELYLLRPGSSQAEPQAPKPPMTAIFT